MIWFSVWILMCFLISLIFKGNDSATIVIAGFFSFLFANELLYKIPFMESRTKVPQEIKSSIKYYFKNSTFRCWWNILFWLLYTLTYFIITHAALIPGSVIKIPYDTSKLIGYVLSGVSFFLALPILLLTFPYQR